MNDLYLESTLKCSEIITKKYSTSFSLGIRLFDKELRSPIYAIYGFVRLADEIVDTFHDFDKKLLLEKFRKDTYQAINDKISLNPILHSFQYVVNSYDIDLEYVGAFLESMEMDLKQMVYCQEMYKKYIYGSAEVVGLMCLKVFVKNQPDLFQELSPYALSLGSAFQKINFLRDLQSDYIERGRTYFPSLKLMSFSNEDKENIENEISQDFNHAFIGIQKLPKNSKLGVYLAYKYYSQLLFKIKKSSAQMILRNRIRVSEIKKAEIMMRSMIKYMVCEHLRVEGRGKRI